MTDHDCVEFLQWALPRLHLRWPGYRKVRRQVCKRVGRRLQELGLSGIGEYRAYLDGHQAEWPVLEGLSRIGISRFYRDQGVFQFLERVVLPELAETAAAQGQSEVLCWSLGCAAGEEPYTLAVLWNLGLSQRFPELGIRILATDVDEQAIDRARKACYSPGSLKDLPAAWVDRAFSPSERGFCLKAGFRELVTFLQQDIRETAPEGWFHLILCRNLVFTYFDEALQREMLQKITEKLVPGGALVIGGTETLPEGTCGLRPWPEKLRVYRSIDSLTA